MSSSDVIQKAFAAYRAWGAYLVGLTTAFYLALGVVGLVVAAVLGPLALQIVVTLAWPWAVALVVDAVAAIEEPTADRSLVGRLAAITPYFATVTAVWLLFNLLVGIGFVLLIVPGLIFMTWWALVVPVVVLERTGISAAFSRSKELVTGRGRTVFGTLVMAGVFTLVPLFAISKLVERLPVSPDAAAALAYLAVGGITTPFIALCLVMLYADLRSRFAAPASQFGA